MVEELHKSCGDMDIRAPVGPSRFDQDHLCAGIFAQPIGQDATRRAGTDDHIISPHALPPSLDDILTTVLDALFSYAA